MDKRSDTDRPKVCFRRDCPDHAGDASWLHPAPRPRPVYAAAGRGRLGL